MVDQANNAITDAARTEAATYMAHAIELARNGVGWCSPNPPVGAVIVRNGQIIGEGYHARAGGPHAETVAIAAAKNAGADTKGATLYVTLEPCNHHGRTPPCCDAIVAAGIHDVVVAVLDPNPNVTGGGIDRLRREGIRVTTGLIEAEGRELIRYFEYYARTGRPWVISKYGASLDGKVATRHGASQWITSSESRRRVHDLRHEVDAILVGVDTVITDDPSLTARRDIPSRNPRPVVLDSRGRIPIDSRLVRNATDDAVDNADPRAPIIATTNAIPDAKQRELEASGCVVWRLAPTDDGRVDLTALIDRLVSESVQSLLVEGGATVHGSFFDAGLVNEVWAFVAPMVIGGTGAPGAVGGSGVSALVDATRFERQAIELLGNDVLLRMTSASRSPDDKQK